MITARGSEETTRRQEDKETTTTGVDTTMVCHRVCDYHHYHLEEEERPTTMVTTIGEKAQGEGCHYDTMTRKTITITATQDRLQERFERKRTTTSSDYIIRLTDRLLRMGSKISDCFSQIQLRVPHHHHENDMLGDAPCRKSVEMHSTTGSEQDSCVPTA